MHTLRKDKKFTKQLSEAYPGLSFDDAMAKLFTKNVPAKYLGVELGTKQKPRFGFADIARLRLNPRSKDGSTHGLRYSTHSLAMQKVLPKQWNMLQQDGLKALCVQAARTDNFKTSAFAKQITPALKSIYGVTGVPVHVQLQVLRKGSFAFKGGHRPGMSMYGWARARLTSFLFKGCTYYSPDHLLVSEAKDTSRNPSAAKARAWWSSKPCICRKRQQCGNRGKQVPANALRK